MLLPFFKKDDIMIMNNYRPISLLTAISKLFEKVVFTQLYDYFHNNNLFCDIHYGFLKKKKKKKNTLLNMQQCN